MATGTCLGLLGLAIAASGIWGTLALSIAGRWDPPVRVGLSLLLAACALVATGTLLSRRWRWRAVAAYAVVFALALAWYAGLRPSNDRNWQRDVAVLPYATFEGDLVTVHNIRNFAYRSETDYIPAYYDRRFDLRRLEGVDLVAAYWMGPAIAHTFVSFAFAEGEHLAISIETRKEQGESYSTINGFFRQYELFYVVADERDVIRLRTNFRHDPPEDVYVYRLKAPLENGRRLFREYVRQANALRDTPEFYNTLTSNCTTDIWLNSRVNDDHVPFSWKVLASGYVPEYLYEAGRMDTRLPFAELRERALVNARGLAAADAPDFSRRIRLEGAP